jgi:pimeloyl-ACP methyl ester carboxylesterase
MKEHIIIRNNEIKIPAVLWGEPGNRMIIAVHGDFSNKEDTVIELLAQYAISKGYRVLSFDLAEHGERKNDHYECNPWNNISDLTAVYSYAKSLSTEISLFACSMGAYFSLLAYHELTIQKSLFLSPIVNMERVIQDMMAGFQVSEQRLKDEQIIPLPIGKTLDWNYYTYVRQHPVLFNWNSPIDILYGSKDTISAKEEVEKFSEKYQAKLTVLENAEHYFSTEDQLHFFETWLDKNL